MIVTKTYENHASDARVKCLGALGVCPTFGPTHNADPSNKNPLVVHITTECLDADDKINTI